MSDHYNKVQKIALEVYNAKLQSPVVQQEVARIHKIIEEKAAEGEFKVGIRAKVGEKDLSFVCAVLVKEGYVVSTQGADWYAINWKSQK